MPFIRLWRDNSGKSYTVTREPAEGARGPGKVLDSSRKNTRSQAQAMHTQSAAASTTTTAMEHPTLCYNKKSIKLRCDGAVQKCRKGRCVRPGRYMCP